MIRILGQELLEYRDWASRGLDFNWPKSLPWYELRHGMGIFWDVDSPKIECWTGLGPHSPGGTYEPIGVMETWFFEAGADWFTPFLTRLKSGESVTVEDVELRHKDIFGVPMLQMEDDGKFLGRLYEHLRSGGRPEVFFPCCRIVRMEWHEIGKKWRSV